MNLIIKSEWEDSPAWPEDKVWLDGEIRRLLNDCAKVMRFVYPEMPADPVNAYQGTLTVHLYDQCTPWGHSGSYTANPEPWGFDNPAVVTPTLHIAWYWHHTRKHRVIQFEGRNFWNHMLTGRGSFAHAHDGCPLISKFKEVLEEAFHIDIDKPKPDVYLCHRDKPGVEM